MYDSRLGRWLTTDPAGQYWSPYLGMGNRPNMLIDPDGRIVTFASDFIKGEYQKAKLYLGNPSIFSEIENSPTYTVHIAQISSDNNMATINHPLYGTSVRWNPHRAMQIHNDNNQPIIRSTLSPAMILFHEMVHQYNSMKNQSGSSTKYTKSHPRYLYTNEEEFNTITKFENPLAKKLGEGIRTSCRCW